MYVSQVRSFVLQGHILIDLHVSQIQVHVQQMGQEQKFGLAQQQQEHDEHVSIVYVHLGIC